MAGALVLVVAAAGCSGVHRLSFPTPPRTAPTAPAAPSVTLPNLTGVRQEPVYGAPASAPVAVGPGQATINGTVLGPNGAVAHATVEADRFVGTQEATTRTTTRADGSFSFSRILGGRWRIRAWQAPSLDLTTPEVIFLAWNQTQTLTLTLTSFRAAVVSAAIAPSPPVVGQPANLVVRVDNATVNAAGIVTYVPVTSAPLALTGGAAVQVTSPDPATTDGNGDAGFQVVCRDPGPPGLTASVTGVGSQPLALPDCVAPAPPPPPTIPTTVPPPSSTTTTSSTVPSTSSTTPLTSPTTRPHHRRH